MPARTACKMIEIKETLMGVRGQYFNLETDTVAEVEVFDGVNVLLQAIECQRDAAAALNQFHITSHPFSFKNMDHSLLETHIKRLEICVTVRPVFICLLTRKAAMTDDHVAKILENFEVMFSGSFG